MIINNQVRETHIKVSLFTSALVTTQMERNFNAEG